MKKVLVILSIVAVTMSLLLVSCGGGASGGKSPSDVELGFWKLVQKGNYEKAADYWMENSTDDDKGQKEQMKAMSAMFSEKIKQSVEEKGGLKDVKIESETISEDGLTAKVEVLLINGDGTTDEQTKKYRKVDGKWKMDNAVK